MSCASCDMLSLGATCCIAVGWQVDACQRMRQCSGFEGVMRAVVTRCSARVGDTPLRHPSVRSARRACDLSGV